jgi:hypothetical protein
VGIPLFCSLEIKNAVFWPLAIFRRKHQAYSVPFFGLEMKNAIYSAAPAYFSAT